MENNDLDAILEERGEIYGDAVTTHADIAKLWSALLQDKLKEDLGAEEVALMFVVFKALRAVKAARKDAKHDDSYHDMHNYARIAYDCSVSGS